MAASRWRGRQMRTAEEYLQYEHDCRRLAQKLTQPDDKRALELMASAWAKMAAERKARLVPEIDRRSPSGS